MSDIKPVQNGNNNGAFDVEYQMPDKKAQPLLDYQGRVRSSKQHARFCPGGLVAQALSPGAG